jgi:hypothetical protein
LILVAFVCVFAWGLGSALLLGVGWLATNAIQGADAGAALRNAWLFTFNGIIVGATGYGAVAFIRHQRGMLVRALRRVLDVPEVHKVEFERRLARVVHWGLTPVVAAVLLFIGGWIAYGAGIPLRGFSHVYLTLAVVSYYPVGALGLMVFVAVLLLFRFIEENSDADDPNRIRLRVPLRRVDLQTIDLYFIISSGMAILAVYVCFRTTLTAFLGAPPHYYKLMIIPVFFFLPAALIYSFYPRYVLRQVWETDTFVVVDKVAGEPGVTVEESPEKVLELRKLILEVREKMMAERRSIPLFSFKDAPALTMAILMLLQLAAQKDPVILRWVREAFH